VARVWTRQQLEPKIAATTRQFSAALTSGDGAGAAAVYVEDAFLLPPTGDAISGRDAIARFWRSGIEIGLRAVELETVGLTDAGGVLYEHGRYRMLLALADGGSNVKTGAYIVVHVQVNRASWCWAGNAFGRAAETAEVA
jgi:ketosteroid isomerase-like protein